MRVVTLLYFAWVREKVGVASEELALPTEIATAAGLAAWLAARSPGHAEAFADPTKLRCAVDQEMVATDALIGDAKEIAFFPPVTGG